MKRKYAGCLVDQGFTGGRRKKSKGDFSKIPNSLESRFMGLVVANNGDLPGNKIRKELRRYRNHFRLDVFIAMILVILWIIGRNI